MKRIGLLGGTFNPVHSGHIALAQWLIDRNYFDEVWLMLSPRNPLKEEQHPGATDADRKMMLTLACGDNPCLKPCFIEFDMPGPSYTVNTLERLSEENPDCRFSLIIGTDNWRIFRKWREPDEILRRFGVFVYPRPGYPFNTESACSGMTYLVNAPVTDISSTLIRASLATYRAMLPDAVANYITENHLYAER